jgi:hypothetical protein
VSRPVKTCLVMVLIPPALFALAFILFAIYYALTGHAPPLE